MKKIFIFIFVEFREKQNKRPLIVGNLYRGFWKLYWARISPFKCISHSIFPWPFEYIISLITASRDNPFWQFMAFPRSAKLSRDDLLRMPTVSSFRQRRKKIIHLLSFPSRERDRLAILINFILLYLISASVTSSVYGVVCPSESECL